MKVEYSNTEKLPIFAYLRRSTTKEEQSDSILQQEEGIEMICRDLGIDIDTITKFTESKSGFENRTRKEWKNMLTQMDQLKKPCILICRDTSRLSRNPTDNLDIANRMFGDNKTRKSIKRIYFLGDNAIIKEWNDQGDKKHIVDKLHQNYTESLETRTKSINGHILKLEAGIYPYHPAPRGLSRTKLNGKVVLQQNEEMPFVRKAFEMKAERRGHEEISHYLKEYGNINISKKELTERYFSNEVYIGEYTEKNTKKHFNNLIFLEGKPPISKGLWERVQESLAKKGRTYRGAEDRDIFERLIRIEDDTFGSGMICRDPHKGHMYYKNTKHKLNIAESKLLQFFLEELRDVFFKRLIERGYLSELPLFQYEWYWGFSQEEQKSFYEKGLEIFERTRDSLIEDAIGNMDKDVLAEGNKNYIMSLGFQEVAGKSFSEKMGMSQEDFIKIQREKEVQNFLEDTKRIFAEKTKDLRKTKGNLSIDLQNTKKELEEKRKVYRREAPGLGYTREEIQEETAEMDRSINALQEKIDQFTEKTDMEKYFERLPEILTKIVELYSNAIQKANISDMREDLLILFELTVSNGKLNKQKELTVKLFRVLDSIVSSDLFWLEAPSGVEPDYKALQASA